MVIWLHLGGSTDPSVDSSILQTATFKKLSVQFYTRQQFGAAPQLLRLFLESPSGRQFAARSYSTSTSAELLPMSPPDSPPVISPSSSGSVDLSPSNSSSSLPTMAKGRKSTSLKMSSGVFLLPHPDKVAKGGEDWYFMSNTQRAVGVADGVGGWAEVGVDSGAYSRMLMAAANKAFDSQPKALDPQAAMVKAHRETTVRGSCTACILAINGTTLSASNLGDSGYLVMRKGQVLFQTPQQQHSFNFPYQIGSPDSMSDLPDVSQRSIVELQPGDIIILGTDGFCEKGNMDAIKTSQVVCHYARHRAADSKHASPFAFAAFQNGLAYIGGKMDDITVLVAHVQRV
eukprot:gene23519-9042_t